MMESYELTILMPCLNEAETLKICIAKAKKFLQAENIQGEIIIADNGSTDGSQKIAEDEGARVVHVATRGYGAALKYGIAAAKSRYIIMGDADDSYDFFNLMPFLNKLREGYDLVIGNRFQGGIKMGAMPFLNRYLGNPVLSFIGRTFFNSKIGDFHCGLRGFHSESLKKLDLQGDGMEFASEMIVKATLKKLNVTEVPIQLFPDGRSRRPHLRPFRDGWRHLRLLLLFSPRWLFFYPGLASMLIGLSLMLCLMQGPLVIGSINFDIHTMLFASLFMIAGLQAVCFSVFAQLIADFNMKMPFKNQSILRLFHLFTLERGLILGLLFILLGGYGACYTFWYWQRLSFGPLIPTEIMRILIPSVTMIIVGMQFILTSFFWGCLKLHFWSSYQAFSSQGK